MRIEFAFEAGGSDEREIAKAVEICRERERERKGRGFLSFEL